jgi:hypothetical protein
MGFRHPKAERFLENIVSAGNPWGEPREKRDVVHVVDQEVALRLE